MVAVEYVADRFAVWLNSVQTSTFAQRLLARYRSLRQRDQWALLALAVFLAITLIVSWVISPAQEFAYKARSEAARNQHTLQWMQENKSRVLAGSAESGGQVDGESMLSLASDSAKQWQISFKRYEPVDEHAVRIWIESASFNSLIQWIDAMHRQSRIAVREVHLEQTANQSIAVNLVLQH